jgi:hypothetical protein
LPSVLPFPQPLLFRWQMTEGAIATTVTTMTFRTHPQHLRNLLTIQAQLLQTMQQILVQMQDVNQLIQSMEARPSSVKRKSNTQDDVGPTSKINATEKVAPNHKEGSTSAKATTTCFNCG